MTNELKDLGAEVDAGYKVPELDYGSLGGRSKEATKKIVQEKTTAPGQHGDEAFNKYDARLRAGSGVSRGDYRADTQKDTKDLLGIALSNATAELGFGIIEGAALMADVKMHVGAITGAETEYSNALADWAREHKEDNTKEVYRHSTDQGFNPTSGAWWAENSASVVSSITLAVPGMAAVKGLSLLNKALKVQRVLKTAGRMQFAKAIISAGASRLAENAMESGGIVRELQSELEGTINKETGNEYTQSEIDVIKGKAGRDTWMFNSAMLVMDVYQFNKAFKGIDAARRTAKAAGKETAKKAAKTFGQKAARAAGSVEKYVRTNMGSEGLEEGYQYIVGQEASGRSKGEFTGENFMDRFADYVKDDEFLTSVTMGAIGGGLFGGMAAYTSNRNQKAQIKQRSQMKNAYASAKASLDGNVAEYGNLSTEGIILNAQLYASEGKLDQMEKSLDDLYALTNEEIAELDEKLDPDEFRKDVKEAKGVAAEVGDIYNKITDNANIPQDVKGTALASAVSRAVLPRQIFKHKQARLNLQDKSAEVIDVDFTDSEQSESMKAALESYKVLQSALESSKQGVGLETFNRKELVKAEGVYNAILSGIMKRATALQSDPMFIGSNSNDIKMTSRKDIESYFATDATLPVYKQHFIEEQKVAAALKSANIWNHLIETKQWEEVRKHEKSLRERDNKAKDVTDAPVPTDDATPKTDTAERTDFQITRLGKNATFKRNGKEYKVTKRNKSDLGNVTSIDTIAEDGETITIAINEKDNFKVGKFTRGQVVKVDGHGGEYNVNGLAFPENPEGKVLLRHTTKRSKYLTVEQSSIAATTTKEDSVTPDAPTPTSDKVDEKIDTNILGAIIGKIKSTAMEFISPVFKNMGTKNKPAYQFAENPTTPLDNEVIKDSAGNVVSIDFDESNSLLTDDNRMATYELGSSLNIVQNKTYDIVLVKVNGKYIGRLHKSTVGPDASGKMFEAIEKALQDGQTVTGKVTGRYATLANNLSNVVNGEFSITTLRDNPKSAQFLPDGKVFIGSRKGLVSKESDVVDFIDMDNPSNSKQFSGMDGSKLKPGEMYMLMALPEGGITQITLKSKRLSEITREDGKTMDTVAMEALVEGITNLDKDPVGNLADAANDIMESMQVRNAGGVVVADGVEIHNKNYFTLVITELQGKHTAYFEVAVGEPDPLTGDHAVQSIPVFESPNVISNDALSLLGNRFFGMSNANLKSQDYLKKAITNRWLTTDVWADRVWVNVKSEMEVSGAIASSAQAQSGQSESTSEQEDKQNPPVEEPVVEDAKEGLKGYGKQDSEYNGLAVYLMLSTHPNAGKKGVTYIAESGALVVDKKALAEDFIAKVWTTPASFTEKVNGESIVSKAKDLVPNTFASYEVYEKFRMAAAYAASKLSHKDYRAANPTATAGDYLTELNNIALKAVGLKPISGQSDGGVSNPSKEAFAEKAATRLEDVHTKVSKVTGLSNDGLVALLKTLKVTANNIKVAYPKLTDSAKVFYAKAYELLTGKPFEGVIPTAPLANSDKPKPITAEQQAELDAKQAALIAEAQELEKGKSGEVDVVDPDVPGAFSVGDGTIIPESTQRKVRKLATQMAEDAGLEIEFINDPSRPLKGKIGKKVTVNLAKATMDTPIHEMLGHPIVSLIKTQNPALYKALVNELLNGKGREVLDALPDFYKGPEQRFEEALVEYASKLASDMAQAPKSLKQRLKEFINNLLGKDIFKISDLTEISTIKDLATKMASTKAVEAKVWDQAGEHFQIIENYEGNQNKYIDEVDKVSTMVHNKLRRKMRKFSGKFDVESYQSEYTYLENVELKLFSNIGLSYAGMFNLHDYNNSNTEDIVESLTAEHGELSLQAEQLSAEVNARRSAHAKMKGVASDFILNDRTASYTAEEIATAKETFPDLFKDDLGRYKSAKQRATHLPYKYNVDTGKVIQELYAASAKRNKVETLINFFKVDPNAKEFIAGSIAHELDRRKEFYNSPKVQDALTEKAAAELASRNESEAKRKQVIQDHNDKIAAIDYSVIENRSIGQQLVDIDSLLEDNLVNIDVAIAKNNGNPMHQTISGEPSKLFKSILRIPEVNNNREVAAKVKALVYSDSFASWFGDWVNGAAESKIIDENGEPILVFHGTNKIFDTFDKSKRGDNTGTWKNRKSDSEMSFMFSSSASVATSYGLLQRSTDLRNLDYHLRELTTDSIEYLKKEYPEILDGLRVIKAESGMEGARAEARRLAEIYRISDKEADFQSMTNRIANLEGSRRAYEYLEDNRQSLMSSGIVGPNRYNTARTPDGEFISADSWNTLLTGDGTLKSARVNVPVVDATDAEFDMFLEDYKTIMDVSSDMVQEGLRIGGYAPKVYPVFLKATSVNKKDFKGRPFINDYWKPEDGVKSKPIALEAADLIEDAINKGYEGSILESVADPRLADNYAVFEPEQVKSVFDVAEDISNSQDDFNAKPAVTSNVNNAINAIADLDATLDSSIIAHSDTLDLSIKCN